ncbi:bacterial transcriptional activator domain-containing protein [Kitasatospora sp. NBC_00070]|uniref:AfsR/SARP family transcriptional regulator n=1 Tax=Kitasatospora sp. NBC_00070 TaxID=2975962 RepID=UPI0032433D67
MCLDLLRGFEVSCAGTRIPLPAGAQHLLAFLALQGVGGAQRITVAEQLWPDCTSWRAAANLRSALCRSRLLGGTTAIDSVGQRLRLAPAVRVDLHTAGAAAQQIFAGLDPLPASCAALVDALSGELLPGWTEDWLLLERERWDQTRLHALEALAHQLHRAEQYLAALETALTAVSIDPIRETAHRIVIEVHLAEGNLASALRCYQQYRGLLQRELNVAPSPRMTSLVKDLMRT